MLYKLYLGWYNIKCLEVVTLFSQVNLWFICRKMLTVINYYVHLTWYFTLNEAIERHRVDVVLNINYLVKYFPQTTLKCVLVENNIQIIFYFVRGVKFLMYAMSITIFMFRLRRPKFLWYYSVRSSIMLAYNVSSRNIILITHINLININYHSLKSFE